jgi:hypothetical protein
VGEVWWHCPPTLEGRLRQSLAIAVTRWEQESRKTAKPYQVRLLPAGVWP